MHIVFVYLGCQNTPAKESRYCSLHEKHATSFKDDMAAAQNVHQEEDSTLIVKILDHRSTRQDKFYEVMLHSLFLTLGKLQNECVFKVTCMSNKLQSDNI